MASRLVRFCLLTLLAALVAAVATWGIARVWVAIGGGPLSIHGWIALTLGIVFTVGLGWGLMALAFHSSRAGWDDRVDNGRPTRPRPGLSLRPRARPSRGR